MNGNKCIIQSSSISVTSKCHNLSTVCCMKTMTSNSYYNSKNKDLRNLLILIEYNDNTRLSLFKLILWFGTSLFYVLCYLLYLQLLLTLPIIILVIILILILILIYIIRSSYNQIYTYEWICSDCWLAKG